MCTVAIELKPEEKKQQEVVQDMLRMGSEMCRLVSILIEHSTERILGKAGQNGN